MYPSFAQFCRWATEYTAIPVWIEPELPTQALLDWAHTLHSERSDFFLLQSAPQTSGARYSYVAFDAPRYTVECQPDGLTVRYHAEENHTALKIGNPVQRFHDWFTRFQGPQVAGLPPFWGGAVGYFSAETARHLDPRWQDVFSAKRDAGSDSFPEFEFGIYDAVAAIDAARQRLWLVHTVLLPKKEILSPHHLERIYRSAQDRLRRMAVQLQRVIRVKHIWGTFQPSTVQSDRSTAAVQLLIRRARAYLNAGDLTRCPISQRFHGSWEGDPWSLFRKLSQPQCASYGAFWRSGSRWLASASNTLLVRQTTEEGSAPQSWKEVLQASFPGGIITGCPRARSIELLQKWGEIHRGPYGGGLGWIGFNGDITLATLVQTFLLQKDALSFTTTTDLTSTIEATEVQAQLLQRAEELLRALPPPRVKPNPSK